MDVRFAPADPAAPPGSDLLAAMVEDLVPLYGRIDGADAPSATPEDFSPPGGLLLVGWASGEPVACGGLKRLDGEAVEIKRMYVVPAARGRGVAKALLAALEAAARELGYAVVRLDTGPKQPHARAMYEAAGYRPIPDYNDNPHASFWGEKRLAAR
jgi:GNAT superfamily N-acetyltransferase